MCGVLANEGAEYCPNCSSELELDLMCPNCDEKLDDPDSCDLCRWESGDDLSEPITGSDHLRAAAPVVSQTRSPSYQGVYAFNWWTRLMAWSEAQSEEPDPPAPWWHWVIFLAVVVALVAIFSAAGLITVDSEIFLAVVAGLVAIFSAVGIMRKWS